MKRLSIWIVVILLSIFAVFYIWHKYHQETPFLLASEGAAATTWLTDVLNSIDQVNCTHYYFLTADMSISASENLRELSLPHYLELLKTHAEDKRIYGNVHGYILSSILNKKPSSRVKIANLVRHPIMQINSMQKFWLRKAEMRSLVNSFMQQKEQTNFVFPASIDQYTPSFNEALQYAKLLKTQGFTVPEDTESWTFLIILGRYNRVHNDMILAEQQRIPQFKFEEYTTDPEVLGALIRYISNNTVSLNTTKLSSLLAIPASNVNNQTMQTPEQIYATWAPWQKQAFALHLQQIGGRDKNAYTQLGYDLSFVAL